MKRLTIRPSTVGSYLLCGGRPGQKDMPGYQIYPNEVLLFGSGMHWLIEQRLEGHDPSPVEVELQLHLIYVKDIPETYDMSKVVFLNKVTNKAQRKMMAKEIVEAVDLWETQVRDTLPDGRMLIEKKMTAEVCAHDDYAVDLTGTPDVVFPDDGVIIDWKSAGKMWDPKKMQGQIQPIAYPWLVSQALDIDITEFIFWVYDRKGKWWAPFTRQGPTEGQVAAFRDMARVVAINLHEGTWTWNPSGQGYTTRGWHCSAKYCDAWSLCVGKFLIADGKDGAEAPTQRERMNR